MMNIQAEKIELIRLITEINSENVLKKIRQILASIDKDDETQKFMSNHKMMERLKESKQQISEGKGIKVSLDDIWK